MYYLINIHNKYKIITGFNSIRKRIVDGLNHYFTCERKHIAFFESCSYFNPLNSKIQDTIYDKALRNIRWFSQLHDEKKAIENR